MENLDTAVLERKLKSVFLFLFFLVVFFSFVYPIIGADIPWHLKTGEYILTHRTIPQSSDPFSFAREKIPFTGRFILSHSWIAQVLFFGIYRALGPIGLVLARAVVFTLIIAIIWYLVYRRKGFLTSILAAGVVTYMLQVHFSSIRPQIFTFLFSAVVILLIEKYKETRSVKWLSLLPFLMLLWANMHGGFIYGVVLILIYLLGEAAGFLMKGRPVPSGENSLSARQLGLLLAFSLLSVLFSLINPNTYKAFVFTFMTQSPGYNIHSLYSQMIMENQSPFSHIGADPASFYGFLVCAACALVMAIVFTVRRQPTGLLLVLFSLTPALIAIRYIPLFLIVAAPLVAHMPRADLPKAPRTAKIGILVAAIAFLSFIAISGNPFRSRVILRFNNSFHYPVRAADFLLQNGIKGNIFASYNTAAFILFKCYPGSRIYFDSRAIDAERITRGLEIEEQAEPPEETLKSINRLLPAGVGPVSVPGRGQKGTKVLWNETKWKELLEKIDADIIVHEAAVFRSGEIYPFVFKLARDDDWKLIYVDGTVMIFVKDEPRFRKIIARYQLPKSWIFDEILAECRRGAGMHGEGYYSSSALAMLLKGVADRRTSSYIDKALSLDPDNFIANYSKALFLRMKHKTGKGT